MIHIQLYTYTCGYIINNNDERTHFFRKMYLSHFIRKGCKRVMCERWVGDWTNCNILTPPSSFALAALLSRSAGLLNQGSWEPIALCWVLVLSTASYLQLTDSKLQTNWTSCHTGLYHCLAPTCFLWALHLHRIQPIHSQGYTLISSTGCTCSLINSWVRVQYVTYRGSLVRCIPLG